MGISGIISNVFSWFGKGNERKAQIDMLIDRADKTINVCEMKFYNHPYAMTAKGEADIERNNRSVERAIWELLQNARDLSYHAITRITLSPDSITFAHKGEFL